jgi:hypothetical protein
MTDEKTNIHPIKEKRKPRTDYSQYEIDYAKVDEAFKHATFDDKTLNKDLYYLLGWSNWKFYEICKYNPEFSAYLAEKRKICRYTKFRRLERSVTELAIERGNITALIFALKALGVSDGSEPHLALEPDKPKGDVIDLTDCTVYEMKQIKRIAEKIAKRKTEVAKTVEIDE